MSEEANRPPTNPSSEAEAEAAAKVGKAEAQSPAYTASRRNQTTPKDPLFKDIISLYFTDHSPHTEFSVNPGLQVGQTQLEIDVAVRASEQLSQTEIYQRLKDTPFSFFAYLNVLEFKSVNDRLDLVDFYRIAARALLAAAGYYERRNQVEAKGRRSGRQAKKSPQVARVISCLICATYPQGVQDQLHTPFQRLVTQPAGFYLRPHSSELYLPSYLIVCSELPLEEKYYPLLVFAAGNKLEAFIELVIDRELEVYVKYMAKLHADKVAEALANRKRGGKMTVGQERLAEVVAEILGPERLAQQLGVEQLILMLRYLKPDLSDEELKRLLKEAEQKSVAVSQPDQNSQPDTV